VSPGVRRADETYDYGWDSADEFFNVVSPEQHRAEPLSPIVEPRVASLAPPG